MSFVASTDKSTLNTNSDIVVFIQENTETQKSIEKIQELKSRLVMK